MIFDEERVGDFVPLRKERDQLQARVELLTAALKKVTDYFSSAPITMSTGQWEALTNARAALAAGVTESEA